MTLNKYQSKNHTISAHAQWWDYGWNGANFITIYTQYRKHFLREIIDGKMILSHLGVIVDLLWHQIPNNSTLKIGAR